CLRWRRIMNRAVFLATANWARLGKQMSLLGRHLQFGVLAIALLAGPFALAVVDAQAQINPWISSWTASPQAPRGVMPTSFSNQTIRQIVRLSIGGNKVKIRLSNEFGTVPLL